MPNNQLETLAREAMIEVAKQDGIELDDTMASWFLRLQMEFLNEVIAPQLAAASPIIIAPMDDGGARQREIVLAFAVENGWITTMDVEALRDFAPTLDGRHVHAHISEINGREIARFAIEADHGED